MLHILRLKALKIICLVARSAFNRSYLKLQNNLRPSVISIYNAKLYFWSEYHICYTLHRVYVWPGFMFRSISNLLTFVASKNTISINPVQVHSQFLGDCVYRLIHKIPDEFRYPKMKPLTPPAIGQAGRDQ